MSNNKEKFSSFKKQKSLTEGWRKYTNTEKKILLSEGWEPMTASQIKLLVTKNNGLIDMLDWPVGVKDLEKVYDLVKGLRSKYVINKYQDGDKEGAIFVLKRIYKDETHDNLEDDIEGEHAEHEGGLLDLFGAGSPGEAQVVIDATLEEIKLQERSANTGIAIEVKLRPFENEGSVKFYDKDGADITDVILNDNFVMAKAQNILNNNKKILLQDTYAKHGIDFLRAFSISVASEDVAQYDVPPSTDPRKIMRKNPNWRNWWQGEKRTGIKESKLHEVRFTKIDRRPGFTAGSVTKKGAATGKTAKDKKAQKSPARKSKYSKQYHLANYSSIANMLRNRGYPIPTGEKARLEKINQMVDEAGLVAGKGKDFDDYPGMMRALEKAYQPKGKKEDEPFKEYEPSEADKYFSARAPQETSDAQDKALGADGIREMVREKVLEKLNPPDDLLDESTIAKSVIENLMEYEYFKDLALQTKKKDVE